jgi:hypothetical protein
MRFGARDWIPAFARMTNIESVVGDSPRRSRAGGNPEKRRSHEFGCKGLDPRIREDDEY